MTLPASTQVDERSMAGRSNKRSQKSAKSSKKRDSMRPSEGYFDEPPTSRRALNEEGARDSEPVEMFSER